MDPAPEHAFQAIGVASTSNAATSSSGAGGGLASSSSPPLGYGASGGAVINRGLGDGTGALLEHSPAARSSKAPSEQPSEFSSWHDDASSSLATLSVGDRTITVNTQRMRMGEHLKGKLQGMIRQRFENYLRITQTLQNDTGKLAALECELRVPDWNANSVRTSISCNEDGTFLVYLIPDHTLIAALGSQGPSGASSAGSDHNDGSEAAGGGVSTAPNGLTMVNSPTTPVGTASTLISGEHHARRQVSQGRTEDSSTQSDCREMLRRWVAQVCEFGMSGRCHSLTALFHFGYTAWKQLCGDAKQSITRNAGGAPSSPIALSGGSNRGGGRRAANGSIREASDHGHIAEEEEKRPDDREDDAPVAPIPFVTDSAASEEVGPAVDESAAGVIEAPRADIAAGEAPSPLGSEQPLIQLLSAARLAADAERHHQALELCAEGIALARSSPSLTFRPRSSSAASSSAAPVHLGHVRISENDPGSVDASCVLWQLLLIRSNVQVQLHSFRAALSDAEELISLQPTCAEGYYWQAIALQGLGHVQEALEALMSALEYEPQNSVFQQAFTFLFEDISATSEGGRPSPRSQRRSVAVASASSDVAGSASGALPRRPPRGGWQRGGGGLARDALSTTTQATHLSSRSTTPSEVSEPLARSSSNDSLSVAGAVFEEPP